MKILKTVEKTSNLLKSLFLNGLFAILPITATLFFLHFTYNLLIKWLRPLKQLEPTSLQKIPGAEIIIVTAFIFIVGALMKFFVVEPIIHKVEKIIAKIPLIRTVYSSVKILGDFFNVSNPSTDHKKVVLVNFPKKGTFNLGFQLESTGDDFQKLLTGKNQDPNKKYCKVFMPNSPNPTSGYFLILPEDEVIPTDITFEEAIKAIVSCGLITPETLRKNS